MKGDGNIKIKIKILNLGLKNKYQAHVKIYDDKNIIFDGYTYNGEIELCLDSCKVYRIEAYFMFERLNFLFYTNTNYFVFAFNQPFNNNTITFSLIDYYYNLPIEKGELILWQK